ncbi:hypothetical protein BJF78_05425 [Pseudonocardia sp. CNS-139]|nr:hypothetical protein BJF78_05425 [Pseudonocardia sp. CNS-139]
MRHSRILAALGAAVAVLLAGCGGTAEAPAPAEPGTSGAFPATVEHKYGTTTIPAPPQRVVTIGYQEHDFVYALGVQPVGVRWWYGPQDDVIHPWAEDAAAGSDPEILVMDTVDLERVAALDPDLILGVYSGITEGEYQQLSRIAPTVTQSGDHVDYGSPWQETTRLIGQALGRGAEAERLVTDLEARFAAIRSANPQLAGRSVVVAAFGPENIGVFASEDPRSRFFTELGLTVPAEIDALAGEQFYATLSFEQTSMLDRDVLIWDQLSFTPGGRATVEQNQLVQQLAVSREARSIFLEGDVEAAFGWNTVLSIPYALDAIEPELARVTG